MQGERKNGAMQVNIHQRNGQCFYELSKEWYGRSVNPPYRYRLTQTEAGLLFEAERAEVAAVHPGARPGCFQEELWRYDVAEFFIASADAGRYLEMNLSPNGAWWGCVFSAPRVADDAASALLRVEQAQGVATPEGWRASLLLPAAVLANLGLSLASCRLAVCAVLESPHYIYLTTAEPCNTQPDFHRPDLWQAPLLG